MTRAVDERIERLRLARPDEREQGIADLIDRVGRPLARQLLQRFRQGRSVDDQDAEDILSTVSLRLLTKLRDAAASPVESIEHLDGYVATLTLNAVNDHLRRRFPERTRLKNRIRYTLTHDARLALWKGDTLLICGLAKWRGSEAVAAPPPLHDVVTRRAGNRERPADALAAFFAHCGGPVAFETVIDTMAELWHIVDVRDPAGMRGPEAPSALETAESRQTLAALWREIVQLRPMQRQALLLNLRDPDASHALSLFVFTGIASFEELADALGMAPVALQALWNELPLDDLRIAEMLQVTRQQVVNLRKSARERLTRRLRKGGA
ncbi:MAG TPA: hypothetical protein VEO54_21085 [Thermoanaerobaculia bacterium]|nr:hypothetical protein [Thermoanaerobaculia bacterium]